MTKKPKRCKTCGCIVEEFENIIPPPAMPLIDGKFCCEGCKDAFKDTPEHWARRLAAIKKTDMKFFGRYLGEEGVDDG